jgi:hypothetical protein
MRTQASKRAQADAFLCRFRKYNHKLRLGGLKHPVTLAANTLPSYMFHFQYLLGLLLAISTLSFPVRAQALDIKADIAAHPVLGALTFDEVQPAPRLRLFVELAEGVELDRIDREFAALLAEVEARLTERIGVSRGPSEVRVVVTRSSETWRKAQGENPRPTAVGAVFVPDLGERGAVLTYDLAWPGSARHTREGGLYEALAQALIAGEVKDADSILPGALIGGLSRIVGFDLERDRPIQDRLIEVLLEGGFDEGFFEGATTLFGPKGLDELWQVAILKTTEGRDSSFWAGERYESRINQAAFFLATALATKESRNGALEQLVRIFAGTQDATDFAASLEAPGWGLLLSSELRRDPTFDPRGLNGTEVFESSVANLTFPVAVSPEPSGPADCLAEGLWLASKGELGNAQLVLSALPGSAEALRHLQWIQRLDALRLAYLEHLADSSVDQKLHIDFEGRTLSALVTRVGLRRVFLEENSRGVDSLEIESLSVGGLAIRMEKESPAFGDPAERAWAVALDQGRWSRSLTAALKKDEELRGDLDAVAGQLIRGRMLSQLGIAEDETNPTAEDRLAAIAALMELAPVLPEVEEHKATLRDIATKDLSKRFEGLDLATILSAKSVTSAGDRMTVQYDFSTPEQLLDWSVIEDYSPEFVTLFPAIEAKSPTFEMSKKGLVLMGSIAIQHMLTFGGPLKLSYEFNYVKPKSKKEAGALIYDYFSSSLCDDLAFQHLRTSQFGNIDIWVTATENHVALRRETPLTYATGKTYTIEAELDEAGQFTTRLDGVEVFTAASPGSGPGRLVFMSHSDRLVELLSVTIEGRLADVQAEAQNLWMDAQLHLLGL